MPDYGQLSGRNLEDNLAGARIAVEAQIRQGWDRYIGRKGTFRTGLDRQGALSRRGEHLDRVEDLGDLGLGVPVGRDDGGDGWICGCSGRWRSGGPADRSTSELRSSPSRITS